MDITESIKLIAKALGVDESKLNIVTNEVYKNDRLNGDDCRQLQDLGFPIYKEIAKLKETTISEAREIIREGKISAVDYNNIMLTNFFTEQNKSLN